MFVLGHDPGREDGSRMRWYQYVVRLGTNRNPTSTDVKPAIDNKSYILTTMDTTIVTTRFSRCSLEFRVRSWDALGMLRRSRMLSGCSQNFLTMFSGFLNDLQRFSGCSLDANKMVCECSGMASNCSEMIAGCSGLFSDVVSKA